MKFRISTILLAIAGLAPPLYAGGVAWKFGCLLQVVQVWAVFVGIPWLFLIFLRPVTTPGDERAKIIGIYGAFAIIPYLVSILLSMMIINHNRPLPLPPW